MAQYEKECKGMFFTKYKKTGELIRTAEHYDKDGVWVVHCWSGPEIQGEYSNQEFKKIKRRYFRK